MSRKQRLTLTSIATLILIVLLAFAVTKPGGDDRISRGVTVGGIEVGGLSEDKASARIIAREDALAALPITVIVDGFERTIFPDQHGFGFNAETAVATASTVGREDSILTQFGSWIRSIFGNRNLPLPASLDSTTVSAVFDDWDQQAALDRDSDANIVVVDGELVASYSSPTSAIVREGATEQLLAVALDTDRPIVELPTTSVNTGVSDADVDQAMALADQLVGGPITLTIADPPATLRLSPGELLDAFTAVVEDTSMNPTLDPTVLGPRFDELREAFSATFKNAELLVSADDVVTIVPGETGLRVDDERIVQALVDASAAPGRAGVLPVVADAAPDITVADLEALKINHVVSAFTTYHDCCQNRVTNIHLMADTIDGIIVMPGETFSVNDTVGQRTAEKGYLPAGTIVNGEIEDTLGGGVSQFATTTYNAIFWGGYTDVTHKPHSIYFSRYPEGIEATLDYPSIDLAFRNDTDGAVYIKVDYTDTSLTIKLLGDNSGRSIIGEQRSGTTNITIAAEGDAANAVIVTGSVSDRYGFTSPDTVYQANAELEPGTTETIQSGREGWSVTIVRIMTSPDGTENTQEWVARYRSQPHIIEIHPCEVPSGNEGYTGQPCPTTTTSSVPDSSTTTESPDSTTTTTVSG